MPPRPAGPEHRQTSWRKAATLALSTACRGRPRLGQISAAGQKGPGNLEACRRRQGGWWPLSGWEAGARPGTAAPLSSSRPGIHNACIAMHCIEYLRRAPSYPLRRPELRQAVESLLAEGETFPLVEQSISAARSSNASAGRNPLPAVARA